MTSSRIAATSLNASSRYPSRFAVEARQPMTIRITAEYGAP
jgi:hypothetical protein